MRISDWSSDVCSSDLARLLQPAPGRSERGLSETLQDWIDTEYRYAARAMLRSVSRVDLVKSRPGFAQNIRPRAGSIIASPVPAPYDPDPASARKSVVSGKSVLVRVDLGGRVIIKKKQH